MYFVISQSKSCKGTRKKVQIPFQFTQCGVENLRGEWVNILGC